MRHLLLSLAAIGLLSHESHAQDVPTAAPELAPQSRILPCDRTGQPWLEEIVRDSVLSNDQIAMAASVANSDGIIAAVACGHQTQTRLSPTTLDDAWHIGSNTKALTALLYARLVEMGHAKWGATLPELFPTLGDDMHEDWSDVTIEDLFAHRTGFQQFGISYIFKSEFDERPLDVQRAETAATWLSRPANRKKGSFDYNNANYVIAGAAIEGILKRKMGQPLTWEEAMQQYVFEAAPIEAAREPWAYGTPETPLSGHGRKVFGGLETRTRDSRPKIPPAMGPAGTLNTPIVTHTELARLFLEPDGVFMTEGMRDKLWTIHPADDPEADYAMGWGISARKPLGSYYGHSGSDTEWLSQIFIFPESDLIMIVNTNQFNATSRKAARDLFIAIADKMAAPKDAEEAIP